MTRLKYFLVFAATCHLVIACLSAANISVMGVPGLAEYAALTGANNGFGFFAPGVGSQLDLSFAVEASTGNDKVVTFDTLEAGMSREAALRINSMIQTFGAKVKEEKLRRSMAASWAGKILARHPGSGRVAVVVRQYDLPSRADYQKGRRPGWVPFYEAKFAVSKK